jgi:hypothetical protein
MVVGSQRGFEIELFDFANTVQSAAAGLPVVPPPPGVYGLLESLTAPNASGAGEFNGKLCERVSRDPELIGSRDQFLGDVLPTNDVAPPFEPTTIWTGFSRGGCTGARRTVLGFSV